MTETLFSASLLLLAVLLLRALLSGKVSARLVYALWLPVLLRLLLPWNLPVSSFSVLPAETLRRTETALSQPADRKQPSAVYTAVPVPVTTMNELTLRNAFPRTAPVPPPVTRADVLRIVWRIGMLAVGGAVLLCNLRFALRLRRIRKPLPIDAPCPVYLAEGLPSPCLYGRAVYLPFPLEGAPLRHVLAHELTHRRHGDALWAALTSVCLTIYWFHPLVWAAAALSRRDCELACDEGALALLGPRERIAYGKTLLTMVENSRAANPLCCATMMSKSSMGVRIRRIAAQPRTRAAAVLALATGLVVACAATCTVPDRFVSRDVWAAVQEGCQSESPAKRAAWERLRDEFLPAYREAVEQNEGSPVLLEAVRLRPERLGLAMGSGYDTFFWDLRPEHELFQTTLDALGLHSSQNRSDDGEWPLWFPAEVTARTDANGQETVTEEQVYFAALQSEHDALRWTGLTVTDPGDDFDAIAHAFLTAIGELHLSAADSGNSGAVSDYEILSAEVYDTLPDDRDHFAFLARMRMTPVDFPNSHWMAGGGVDENGNGTVEWTTEIAVARGAGNVWRITDNGWAVYADREGESGWYRDSAEAAPDPLSASTTDRQDAAREYLEQYGSKLRTLFERKNRCGARDVTFSHLYAYHLEDTDLETLNVVPEGHPEAFYVTAITDVVTPAYPMEWDLQGITSRCLTENGQRSRFFLGLVLWQESGRWTGCILDPEQVATRITLLGELTSPDGAWGLTVGAAAENDFPQMVTLYSTRTGRVRWEDISYYRQTALWSPDSEFLALTRTARYYTEILVIDTDGFSLQIVPLPDPPQGVALAPNTQPNGYALEWLDSRRLRCRVSYPVDPEHEISEEFVYTVQADD